MNLRTHARRVALTVLGLLTATACSGDDVTSVRLEITYEQAWSLETFSVMVQDREAAEPAAPAIRLLVPNDWAGESITVYLAGMRGDRRIANGQVEVTPVRGREVTAPIELLQVSCQDLCTPGAFECLGDGVVVCETDDDGCVDWSAPTPCPDEAPYCSRGECSTECVDECTEDETTCRGADATRACGQADSDECLDWLEPVACPAGQTCSAGTCSSECTNECDSDGQTMCDGSDVRICGDLDSDSCFEWGPPAACPGDATCSGDACVCPEPDCFPIVSLDRPRAIALDSTHFYWASGDGTSAVILRMPKGDDAIETIHSIGGVPDVFGIAADDTHVYWTHFDDGLVMSWFKAGGTVSTVVTGEAGATAITLDDDRIYWTTSQFSCSGRVMVRDKGGSLTSTIATNQCGPLDIAVDDTHVYWTNFDGGQVMRREKVGGGSVQTFASAESGPRGIAIDDTHVYWAARTGGQIRRRAKAGGSVETIASEQDQPIGITTDDTYVYWTNAANGEIVRRAKSGGDTRVIVAGQAVPIAIAVEPDRIYWASEGCCVQQVSRCPCGF